ncbi:MAG: PmoA family protein [Planctomycetes bacterium]|nr:PmoA family protein [Planctomycetota bacterium]
MVPEGDHPVIEYRSGGAIFKPYVRKLFSPAGASVVRDQVPDHLHHHGLMFAVGIDGVDFWSETGACGRQKHLAFDKPAPQAAADAAGVGALAERIDWVGSSGDPVLAHERRTIDVFAAKGAAASLLTWRTEIKPAEGRKAIKIAGSHYFGLGMRLAASMDNEAEFFTAAGKADGEIVRGDERLTRGPWMACAGTVDGKPVTVAMFDGPGNPRPAWWFTMGKPFAYLSATLNLHREPLAVEAGKPLVLCYGVAVWDGKTKAEDIEKLYRQWLETAGDKPGKAP